MGELVVLELETQMRAHCDALGGLESPPCLIGKSYLVGPCIVRELE